MNGNILHKFKKNGTNDYRVYPWGNTPTINDVTIVKNLSIPDAEGIYVPRRNHNFTNPGPEEVGKYPKGASPYGIEDLVGNVWQYTSEFTDIHTRSVILRGGSNYNPWRGKECRNAQNNECAKIKVPGSGNLLHPEGTCTQSLCRCWDSTQNHF